MRRPCVLALVILAVGSLGITAVAHAVAVHPSDSPGTSRQRLIDALAVLRRPQTTVDRSWIRRLRSLLPGLQDPGPESLDESLVRIAGVTPWGFRVVLAGFITTKQQAASRVPEMLGALVGGEIGPRASAADIRARGDVAHFQIEGREIRVVIVVPDGVARLEYSAPGMRTITVAVHNNVAAFVIRPLPATPGLVEVSANMIWFGSYGQVIRRVPSLLNIKRHRNTSQQMAPTVRSATAPRPRAIIRLSRPADGASIGSSQAGGNSLRRVDRRRARPRINARRRRSSDAMTAPSML